MVRDAGVRRRDLASLIAIVVLFNVGIMFLALVVPIAALRLRLSPAALGLLVALPGVFLFVARLFVGHAIDRWGTRAVLRSGAVAFGVGALVLLLWPGWPGLVVEQLLTGMGRAAFMPGTQARLYADGQAQERRVAAYNASVGVGLTFGAAMAGLSLERSFTFARVALVAIALLLGVGTLVLARDRPRDSSHAGGIASGLGLHLLPRLAPACLLAFVAGLPFVLMSSFYPIWGHRIGIPLVWLGSLESLRGIATITAGLTFPWIVRRVGRRHLGELGLVCMAAAVGLTPLAHTAFHLGLDIALANFVGAWVFNESTLRLLDAVPGSERGRALSLTGSAWSLSLLLTPIGLGFAADALGIAAAFWTTAAVALGCLALLQLPGPFGGPAALPAGGRRQQG